MLTHVLTSNVLLCILAQSHCYNGDGRDYSGTLSITTNGRQCQRWDQQSPHQQPWNNPANFPSGDLVAEKNFCRNPDGWYKPWCFTTDSAVRWENCNVPTCTSFGWYI